MKGEGQGYVVYGQVFIPVLYKAQFIIRFYIYGNIYLPKTLKVDRKFSLHFSYF